MKKDIYTGTCPIHTNQSYRIQKKITILSKKSEKGILALNNRLQIKIAASPQLICTSYCRVNAVCKSILEAVKEIVGRNTGGGVVERTKRSIQGSPLEHIQLHAYVCALARYLYIYCSYNIYNLHILLL